MGVAHFLFLSSVGLFALAQAQDCSRPVLGENMGLANELLSRASFPDGTKVKLSCNTGYTGQSGSLSLTCNAGTWSALTLVCERKSCGAVGDVLNGNVQYPTGNQFGDQAIIVCNTGYNLIGRDKCSCESEGKWNCREVRCDVVKCDSPPAVINGKYDESDSYSYREVVQYTCDDGFTMIGSKSITCSKDGRFEPAPPKCTKVECPDVQVANGVWAGGSPGPHGYQATVTFKCNIGFFMDGPASITCQSDSKWSPQPPVCKASVLTCKPPPKVHHGSYSPENSEYRLNEVVTYVCDEGHHMSGMDVLTCSSNGGFTPAPPSCHKKRNVVEIVVGVVCGIIVLALIVAGVRFYQKKKSKSSVNVHDGQRCTDEETGVILSERKEDADAERKD